MTPVTGNTRALIDLDALERLIALLARCGYQVLGPTVCDGAIVYGPLEKLDDLPVGWTAEQEAGRYRLRKGNTGALFVWSGPPELEELPAPAGDPAFPDPTRSKGPPFRRRRRTGAAICLPGSPPL